MDFLFERLRWIAEQTAKSTPWRTEILDLCCPEAWKNAPAEKQGAMMIEVARLLRASHQIPREAYSYVVAWVVENLAEARIAEIFTKEFAPRLREIERAYGMRSYWEFRNGQEPPEYLALSAEFDRKMERTTADMLRAHHEPVLAELYERDRAEYLRLKKSGQFSLLGSGGVHGRPSA
jgi:hypothetical protein